MNTEQFEKLTQAVTDRNQIAMNKKDTHKTSKTIEDYTTQFNGWCVTIPKGSVVTNKTAMGNDDSYRFLEDWRKVAEEITGCKNSTLAHDLTYYGINVPADLCEPYTV